MISSPAVINEKNGCVDDSRDEGISQAFPSSCFISLIGHAHKKKQKQRPSDASTVVDRAHKFW